MSLLAHRFPPSISRIRIGVLRGLFSGNLGGLLSQQLLPLTDQLLHLALSLLPGNRSEEIAEIHQRHRTQHGRGASHQGKLIVTGGLKEVKHNASIGEQGVEDAASVPSSSKPPSALHAD